MIKNIILVFLGGGLGSVLRYCLNYLIPKSVNLSFPVATLLVNVLGSFLIGFVYALSVKTVISEDTRLFMMVGLCGGFTTFSSFSFESLQLLRNGQMFTFISYLLLSILLCLLFVWLGDIVGKMFAHN